jgi:hypothetical protein
LSGARIAAADARKLIAQDLDPLNARAESRKAAKPVPTFQEIAQEVIAEAQRKSTNAKVRYQWERHLGSAYCGPLALPFDGPQGGRPAQWRDRGPQHGRSAPANYFGRQQERNNHTGVAAMRIYQNEQIPALTMAIVQGYPMADGQGTIKTKLWTLGIDFDARATRDATFELTLNDILLQLNQAARLDPLSVLNRDVDDDDLTNRVNGVFGGQQPPYSRALMIELPEKVRGILRDIMTAPTS